VDTAAVGFPEPPSPIGAGILGAPRKMASLNNDPALWHAHPMTVS